MLTVRAGAQTPTTAQPPTPEAPRSRRPRPRRRPLESPAACSRSRSASRSRSRRSRAIQATLADYAAARYRRESGLRAAPASGERRRERVAKQHPDRRHQRRGRERDLTQNRGSSATASLAQVQLSQLLFDFGKSLAATDAARKLAEVAVENVELQRQLISVTVKEAYTNTLFSQRLIRVQEQAVRSAPS